MPKETYKVTITTTHSDCRYFVWVRDNSIDEESDLGYSDATLFKTPTGTKIEKDIDVEKNGYVFVYVIFLQDQYQPGTKFTLKIGNKIVYKDSEASLHHYPNGVIVEEEEMR